MAHDTDTPWLEQAPWLQEPEPKHRRVPVVLIVLAVALAALLQASALAAADWYQRNRAMAALLDTTEASEASMYRWLTEEHRMLDTAPRSEFDPTQFEDPAAVRARVQSAAGAAAAEVLTTGDDVRDVFILPWHFGLKKAQQRYLAHSDAWQTHLNRASTDVAELTRPQPQIAGTFASAKKAYENAVSPFPLHDAPARVEDIFDD